MHVLLLANGTVEDPTVVRHHAKDADLVLCADGGFRHARAVGVRPHAVLGDLDSLPPEAEARLREEGVEFVVHPRAKDETDLELGLLYAIDRGATAITVVGAWGGRIDHALGNLFLLAHSRLVGVDVRIVSSTQTVVLVRREARFSGAAGDLLSLLPLGGDVRGVTTMGLAYPLCDEALYLGPARGISNVFTGPVATVRLNSGLLLAIHTLQQHSEGDGEPLYG
jgi:thiamine pyrophosphokinase